MGKLQSLSSPIAYHRLMKSPLDDSETFTTVTDLMEYCSSGAWYEGQKVSVTVDNGAQFHYVIQNGYPIISPTEGWEPVWVNIEDLTTTAVSSDGGTHGMLIYYWDDSTGKYVSDTSTYTILSDPDCFSIFDTVGIFKTNNNFYFLTQVINRNNNTVYTYLHSQQYDPMEEADSIGTMIITTAMVNPTTLKKLTNTASVCGISCCSSYIDILPHSATTYSKQYTVRIYAISDEYYNAWRGGKISG